MTIFDAKSWTPRDRIGIGVIWILLGIGYILLRLTDVAPQSKEFYLLSGIISGGMLTLGAKLILEGRTRGR